MKTVLVSFAELSDLFKNAKSTEECAQRLDAYKSVRDGTAKKEADIKAVKEAEFRTECAVKTAFNKPVVENYNMVSNAIEKGIEGFKRSCDAANENGAQDNIIPEKITKDPTRCWISERETGYNVNYLGQDYHLDDFEGASIHKTTLQIIGRN